MIHGCLKSVTEGYHNYDEDEIYAGCKVQSQYWVNCMQLERMHYFLFAVSSIMIVSFPAAISIDVRAGGGW